MRRGARVLATVAVAAALSGCAATDLGGALMARLAQRPISTGLVEPDAVRCGDRSAADLSGGRRRGATQIGPALFLGLRRPRPPWRFEVAREHARHLGPSATQSLLANGTDLYAALS